MKKLCEETLGVFFLINLFIFRIRWKQWTMTLRLPQHLHFSPKAWRWQWKWRMGTQSCLVFPVLLTTKMLGEASLQSLI